MSRGGGVGLGKFVKDRMDTVTGNADARGSISDINVTPLVDVTLVLLIIFMLVAPMIEVGINVDLPQAPTKQMDMPQSIHVTIRTGGEVFYEGRKVSLEELERDLHRVAAVNPEIGVIVLKPL